MILRETQVLAALAGTDVPHPRLIAVCDDTVGARRRGLLPDGAVDGFNAGDELPALHASDTSVQFDMGLSMADALARLGAVDHVAVGLGGFGKPDGFLERQVPRWLSELEGYSGFDNYPGPDIGDVDGVATWLDEHRPADWTPGIMHGDYHARQRDVLARPGPTGRAIVDWEMSTIGDPLLDLGWMLATWRYPGQRRTCSARPLMDAEGLPRARRSGEPLRAEHHPRPVEHQLVRGAGLLQARHHPGGHAMPARAAGLAPMEIGDHLHTTTRAPVRARTRAHRGRRSDRLRDPGDDSGSARRDPRIRRREDRPVRDATRG